MFPLKVSIINIDIYHFFISGMSRYYCPFCSPRYEIQKTRVDGVLICGHCGDPLIRKTLINSRQFFGLITALVFVAPLLIMIIYILNDFTKETLPSNSESVVYSYIQ